MRSSNVCFVSAEGHSAHLERRQRIRRRSKGNHDYSAHIPAQNHAAHLHTRAPPARRKKIARLKRERERRHTVSAAAGYASLSSPPPSSVAAISWPPITAGCRVSLSLFRPSTPLSQSCFDRRCHRRRRWAMLARGFARRGVAPMGRTAGATKIEPPRRKGRISRGAAPQRRSLLVHEGKRKQTEKPNFR
jgi:hypothetical protein